MRLSQMQDIGGCRAVVHTLPQLLALKEAYLNRSTAAAFVSLRDYVTWPAASGYRSIHLIYRYSSRTSHRAVFDGLLTEIQLRTQLQHAWATAVETVGTLTSQALKSSEGSAQWLSLFRDIGSLFAIEEGTPPVPGSLSPSQLVRDVRSQARALKMVHRLKMYRKALEVMNPTRSGEARYFLLRLDSEEESLSITGFRVGQIEEATRAYLQAEEETARRSSLDAVLVRADSVEALRKAYPNYFLDTEYFLKKMAVVTQRS